MAVFSGAILCRADMLRYIRMTDVPSIYDHKNTRSASYYLPTIICAKATKTHHTPRSEAA